MKAIQEMTRFDINLISPFVTAYSVIAESKGRALDLLIEKIVDTEYSVMEFEIEEGRAAQDQMGNYLSEEICAENGF